jgi:outer membrane protein assembly factor BamB
MPRYLLVLCASLVGFACYAASGAENWSQFRGPQGDGSADAVDLPLAWSETEHVRWKTAIHDRGWSSPVVWGDQVWMTTATDDGRQLFAVAVDSRSGKILHDVKVFDVEKPEPIIALNSYASPTPAVEEGRVYVHFGSYGTACLDTATGKTLWQRRDLKCNHYRGPGSSLLLWRDRLICTFDGFDVQYLVALDKKTGQTLWKTDRSTKFHSKDGDRRKAYSTPLPVEVNGHVELISPGCDAAMAYAPADGRELWTLLYKGYSNTSRPVAAKGVAFVNTGSDRFELWAVRLGRSGVLTDADILWKYTRNGSQKPSPVIDGGLLYMISDGGIATCLETETGKMVWHHRLEGNYSASPIVAAGRIYFFSHEGVTTVVKPGREFEVLATNKLDAGFMASPAVVGRALIVRTKTHLYRIEQ